MNTPPMDEGWEQRVQKLEEALRSREAILDSLPDQVVIQDLDHRVLWANRAACESLGLDLSSVIERRCHELWCAQADPCPDCPTPEAMETGSQVSVTKTTPDGRSWRIRCIPLCDARGQVTTMIQVTEDISENLRMQQRHQEAEENRKLMLDTMQEMLAYHDTELRVKWTNRAAAESVGLESEDLVGRHCYETWQQRDTPCEGCPVIEAMETGQAREIETVTPDGRVYRIRGYPVYDENGGLKGAVEYGLDITEHKQAEEALKKREAIFRAVFEQSPCAVILLDPEMGEAVEFNEQAHRALGYSREEFQKLRIADIDVQESAEEIDRHVEKVIREGEDTFETRHRTRDGRILHVIVKSRAILLDGKPYLVSLWTDITEHKQAEEALEAQHAKLKSLFDYSGEAIVLLDTENRVQDANRAFEEVFGYSLQETRGEVIQHLICPERFYPESERLDRQSLTVGGIKGVELIRKRKDGNEIHVRASAGPIKSGDEVIGRFVVFDDISDRKRAEEALQRIRFSIENLTDTVMWVDENGHITDVNEAECRRLGYSREELLTMSVADIDPHFPRERWPTHWEEMQRCGVMLIETEHRTRNGDLIPMELVIHHQVFGNRRYNCVLGRDISERRKAEAEREKLEAQLRQSQKMEAVGTLAGGIAHDFNNILGIIVGNAELAMMDIPDWSPAQENLQEVRRATLRARDLVNRILLFARRKEPVVSPIRVESIARESLKMLRASIPSTVDIHQHIEEDGPAVLADPSQIQQIIMNLCTNAAQVLEAEGGTLMFTMNAVVLDAPVPTTTGPIPEGPYVRIQVSDTGPGISPDNLERIFDPFFTTKSVGEGTGLGLAVVHGIVQGINGGIHVESREGQGTTFSVLLPASETAAPDEGEANETGLPRGNERILLVDDEPMILKLGRRILERQGYRVEDRASGTEALELFRENPDRFDLVITDMTMPGMRGDRLAEEIMALRPGTPVILCTGFSKQISEEKARAMGVRAFVMKPLTRGEFTQTVRRVLDEEARKAPSS